jgi:hypothetical protein
MVVRSFNITNHYKPKLEALKSCAKNFGMSVNFTNILRAAISYQSCLRTFNVLTIWVCNFLAKGFWHKAAHKMLVKLTPGLPSNIRLG